MDTEDPLEIDKITDEGALSYISINTILYIGQHAAAQSDTFVKVLESYNFSASELKVARNTLMTQYTTNNVTFVSLKTEPNTKKKIIEDLKSLIDKSNPSIKSHTFFLPHPKDSSVVFKSVEARALQQVKFITDSMAQQLSSIPAPLSDPTFHSGTYLTVPTATSGSVRGRTSSKR